MLTKWTYKCNLTNFTNPTGFYKPNRVTWIATNLLSLSGSYVEMIHLNTWTSLGVESPSC